MPKIFQSSFITFLCVIVCLSDIAKSETIEVPENAENFYSEEFSEDNLQPEITIIRKKNSVHEEYRINGRLYMVKVTPVIGPPYFYVDQNGDGLLDDRTSLGNQADLVPQWVIFSW